MKKIIPLSLITLSLLNASDTKLGDISVESTYITEVAQNAQTSADLAEALSQNVPSVDMNRRSGIANDIYIRGQKRDNISVEVDGTKVCGACPNRMDPPVSHILASQIEDIEVIEGPYDVENFGTLSGGVRIKTKQPTKKTEGKVDLGLGSWGYEKAGFTISGGNDDIKVIVSSSIESSDQYKDGDGNTLAQQVKNNAPVANQYQEQYEDMQAYKKKSLMLKAFINVAKEQELRLSYTANRSDNVLYPTSSMDAIVDDSDIYSVSYNVKNLTDIYKNVNLQYYYSSVDHPMSTEYRNSALIDTQNITNHMDSSMQGIKLKNTFMINNHEILVGLDTSRRTWNGDYYNNVSGAYMGNSIDNSLTKNMAIFAVVKKSFDNVDVKLGARYDYTTITSDSSDTNDYNSLNANVVATLHIDNQNKIFMGVGQAYRVPDGRELYFKKAGVLIGTPTLDNTKNQQVDLGYEINLDNLDFKIKTFYSKLSNYIYYKDTTEANRFRNIDATVYGGEISSTYYIDDEISIDGSIAYKKGEKDQPLDGQTDTDMVDMAPLRTKLALKYEYASNSLATLSAEHSNAWDTYDSDNGEQYIDSWTTVNFKVKHSLNRKFEFTVGINNIFDETYALSNTSKDLTLVTSTTTSEVMLLNEPGRYFYTNLTFKF